MQVFVDVNAFSERASELGIRKWTLASNLLVATALGGPALAQLLLELQLLLLQLLMKDFLLSLLVVPLGVHYRLIVI